MIFQCLIGLAFILVIGFIGLKIDAVLLNGKCGFPGQPYKSKLDNDFKLQYTEGEEVHYQCERYWNYVQIRRCVHGRWTGPPARCADILKNVWLQAVQIDDITDSPRAVSIIKVRKLNLEPGDWKFPNAFTNTRSLEQKFILSGDRLYRWRLSFNDTFSKQFVRFNFNTHGYTSLSALEKQNYTFDVSLEVSAHRRCVLEKQTYEIWKVKGQKSNNWFVCDSKSASDYAKDIERQTNEMILYTRANLNVTYELIAIFLGQPFGTPSEPICGEPEYEIGHYARFNVEYRDYSYECKTDWRYQEDDQEAKLAETSIHFQRCQADMRWAGSYPVCMPKVHCPLDLLTKDVKIESSKTEDKTIVVLSLDNLYFVNESLYYAIEGTVAVYGCTNSSVDILMGKESRICFRNGTWSGNKPSCYDPNQQKYLLLLTISGITILVVLILLLLMALAAKRLRSHLMATIDAKQKETIAVKELMDLYENNKHDSDIYENYEQFDPYEEVKRAGEKVNRYEEMLSAGKEILGDSYLSVGSPRYYSNHPAAQEEEIARIESGPVEEGYLSMQPTKSVPRNKPPRVGL